MVRKLLLSLIALVPLFNINAREYKVEEVPMVHLQDRTRYVSNPDNILSFSSVATMDSLLFSLEEKKSVIAPIGEGNMNYDSIIEACLASDVEIGYVELDDCHGEDPFDCMKRSYNYLTSRYGLK